MTVYITSDLHFGHNRNFIYESRGFSSIEEHDKIPYNIINNNSIEEWIDSIEKYYKNNGGMCP